MLALLISEFQECGYNVTKPWHVLNSKNYGVPQHRERLFLLGAKSGLPLPEYPSAKSDDQFDLFNSDDVQPVPTCRDALEDLPDNEMFDELIYSDSIRLLDWAPKTRYARELHCMTNGCWHYGYQRKWDNSLLTSSLRTDHTDISRHRFANTLEGQIEPVSRFFKLASNGQCNTLRAGTDSARGAFTSPRPIHYDYNRCISVREMARLHGYPDWFRFHVTKWHGARQIGNSVPPPLAWSVASSIICALGVKPIIPSQVLDLCNQEMLSMDMTAASKYCFRLVAVNRILPNQLSVVQTKQDIAFCQEKFKDLQCRAISAQFISSDLIALFELTLEDGMVRIVDEKHYKLVSSNEISSDDLHEYASR
ncbi:MAG: DNA cytosine methyltransferase [Kiritimatiellia bacterium]